ncbi:MAG: hypothetical protein IE887_04015 [Campylobacterales bacterium]|nr:hypothetical protein [Campylobacterales bacterium]
MSYSYLVTLKPQEPFFFGGEHTFGRDDSRKEGSRYSASSTYFPQQSALLGMLRKTMLIQNNNLTMHIKGEWIDSKGSALQNYTNALKHTGKDSFSYEQEVDLGIIENISPLFITKENKGYITNAKDEGYTPKLIDSLSSLGTKGTQKTIVFEGLDPKAYISQSFIAEDKTLLCYDDVFESITTVGIKKAKDGVSNEDGFFQKSSYMLKDKAFFSFYITVSEALSWSDAYVTLGADQSSFLLTLTQTSSSFEEQFKNTFTPKSLDRVILNSETLLTSTAYESALFVLGKRSSYRQLKDKKGNKSKRYYLLERGSVIYAQDLTQLTQALSQPHLQRVGINNFTTIKGN